MAKDGRGRDPETLRMYWALQWERNAQLEEQRLGVSNFVIAGSVVGLGIFAVGDASPIVAWILALAVALSNVFALVHSLRSESWARLHKARARQLLEDNWAYLKELQATVDEGRGRPHGAHAVSRRLGMQIFIHLTLVLAAVALALFA